MKANSRSVNAIRKADCGNHRIAFPPATRPGRVREKDDDERRFCLSLLALKHEQDLLSKRPPGLLSTPLSVDPLDLR